ncbi:aldehyde dehydrogenase [Cordyceps militaris]|uniref:Aldehyde dehydrogenase n=1 Tax=Cordyceps militaris TaxID=73501 RepID=A0A2H4S5T3_CORMI|nr:aldehyde dehydrogenase [Cordyceps militaris]
MRCGGLAASPYTICQTGLPPGLVLSAFPPQRRSRRSGAGAQPEGASAIMTLTAKLSTPVTGNYDQPIGLFINNEWVEGVDKQKFEVINPSTEEVITSVCEATEKDVDLAVAAARKAFNTTWKETTPHERGRYMNKLADIVEKNTDLLAAVESLDNGKSITMAKGDVGAVVGCIRYYAGWADKIEGKTTDVAPDMFHYIRKEPIGVCGQIIPWNFPLLMLSWKIGPALATGNTIVMKTAEQTPLSGLVFAHRLPPGVFNLISGFGKTAGAALSNHMDVDKIAFTGSTLVGRTILKAAASSNLKKVTLELGGKSPNIVFNDADIESAISWVNFGIYFNHGQCCCAGSRIFVQEGIYDKFLEAFKKRAAANAVGDPFDSKTFQGPQVSQLQYDRIMSYIKSGKEEGATVEIGGERHGDKGYFIKPTIFSNVRSDMKIMQEEIFGPVCSISKFSTEEEAIKLGNETTYGLAAAVHTKDLNTSIRVSNALKAGTVWVNCYNMINFQVPFGGFKESGIGRELGEAALDNYLQTKSVAVRLGGPLFG